MKHVNARFSREFANATRSEESVEILVASVCVSANEFGFDVTLVTLTCVPIYLGRKRREKLTAPRANFSLFASFFKVSRQIPFNHFKSAYSHNGLPRNFLVVSIIFNAINQTRLEKNDNEGGT